jgi:hypothetical protein
MPWQAAALAHLHGCSLAFSVWQAITRAIEAQDRLVEEAKTGIVETALGTNE